MKKIDIIIFTVLGVALFALVNLMASRIEEERACDKAGGTMVRARLYHYCKKGN